MEMLVWQLRRDGEKLPKDGLDGPRRGWLRMHRGNINGRVTLHAGLYSGSSPGAPPVLRGMTDVEIRRLDERGLLLYGIQYRAGSPMGDPGDRQAWFCQPVARP